MTVVVIGATGAIGNALATLLERHDDRVVRLGRRTDLSLDLTDEASIERAAEAVGSNLRLVIDATGFLHGDGLQPERTWRQIDPKHMAISFQLNAIGPALLMKHFLPRLARDERAVFATLSARIGSIGDNTLGGWYSYRASKAALNQLVRTAAIELSRSHPQAMCVALHPGTVASPLSEPFSKAGLDIATPEQAAHRILAVIAGLQVAQTGTLIDQHGKAIPF